MSNFQNSNQYVFYTLIEDENGNLFDTFFHSKDELNRLIRSSAYYPEILEKKTSYNSPVYQGLFDEHSFYFYSQYLKTGTQSYIYTICYNTDTLLKNNSALMRSGIDQYLLQNWQGECVFSTSYDDYQTNKVLTTMANYSSSRESVSLTGNITLYDRIGTTGGKIAGVVSLKNLLNNSFQIFGIVVLLLIISPIVLYIAVLSTLNTHLSALSLLIDSINRFKIGEAPPEIITTGDEIQTLSTDLSNMATSINSQALDIIDKEQINAVTKYKVLATQLDPHFVSNTMAIINVMARAGRTDDIIKVNNALLRILRDRLSADSLVFNTVEDDITMLKQYMLIVNYRYQNNVRISYDISDKAKNKLIPKNILQLLVENALFHGFQINSEVMSGEITIMIYPNSSELVIEVDDNGRGIEPAVLQAMKLNHFSSDPNITDRTHIGLQNINERLNYIYPGKFKFDINSEIAKGTSVVISIPMSEEQPA